MIISRPSIGGRCAAASFALVLAGCGGNGGADTPTRTPTATVIIEPTETATAPSTATTTSTAPPTTTSTATPMASATASPTASATPSSTPTASATSSSTPTDSPPPTPTESLLRLPALHAAPDPDGGGRIVDDEQREVLLRGVNLNALLDYWKGGQFPTVFPFTPADADLMASIGWNVVRLGLSWSRIEPQTGIYDDDYLQEALATVRLLASRGLYAIIDLHQDAWGATLAAPPEESCSGSAKPALGWDGAPAWATLDGGMPRCAPGGVRELSPAVMAAFTAFFDDAPGPDGIGIRTRYVAMLGHVASVLAAEPGVAGYDLMNEPNAFGAAESSDLSAMYADALVAIRAAERDAASPPRLIFFEPSALWSLIGSGPPPDFARDGDVVYAPHIYIGSISPGTLSAAVFQVPVDEAKGFGGAPVLVGEWGSDPRSASDPTYTYFLDHQALQDQFFFGATLWTWRESCGDPSKQADFRAGNIPTVWGEFEVDCTTNTVTGLRHDVINELTRAYVRAAPGHLQESSFDYATGAFTAHGTAATAGDELLAFYPASLHGAPALTASGLTDVRQVPAPGNNLYIVAHAIGGDWSLATQ